MWPIVPTLTCGLVRSNFCFDIFSSSHGFEMRQRPPAKQVAWIFGYRPKRQKRTAVLFALNLPPGAKHPVFMARINF
jgi:hypothetical protein